VYVTNGIGAMKARWLELANNIHLIYPTIQIHLSLDIFSLKPKEKGFFAFKEKDPGIAQLPANCHLPKKDKDRVL
jgi:hypothetical protein